MIAEGRPVMKKEMLSPGIQSVAENVYSNMISRTEEITTGLVHVPTKPTVR